MDPNLVHLLEVIGVIAFIGIWVVAKFVQAFGKPFGAPPPGGGKPPSQLQELLEQLRRGARRPEDLSPAGRPRPEGMTDEDDEEDEERSPSRESREAWPSQHPEAGDPGHPVLHPPPPGPRVRPGYPGEPGPVFAPPYPPAAGQRRPPLTDPRMLRPLSREEVERLRNEEELRRLREAAARRIEERGLEARGLAERGLAERAVEPKPATETPTSLAVEEVVMVEAVQGIKAVEGIEALEGIGMVPTQPASDRARAAGNLLGVNLQKAMVLGEILGPPRALRRTHRLF